MSNQASKGRIFSIIVLCIVAAHSTLIVSAPSAVLALERFAQNESEAERVKITSEYAKACIAQTEITNNESDVRQRIGSCVNAWLAREGKPWRWNASAADISIQKK